MSAGFRPGRFPTGRRVLDGRPGRGAGAAIMAAITTWSALHLATPAAMVPTPTSDTSLTRCRCAAPRSFQVVDQLGQVFDGVDVVVRRRRYQAHAGTGVAQLADVFGHLAAGQLAALAGLGALGHLDLDLVGAGQVFCRHTKATGGHLLDAAERSESPSCKGRSTSTFSAPITLFRLSPRLDRECP